MTEKNNEFLSFDKKKMKCWTISGLIPNKMVYLLRYTAFFLEGKLLLANKITLVWNKAPRFWYQPSVLEEKKF
jgi:hypothetical protein